MRKRSTKVKLQIAIAAAAMLIVALPAVTVAAAPAPSSQPTSMQSASALLVDKVAPPRRQSSAYTSWKRSLPFWPRKGWLLGELTLFIAVGVVLAQVLEVAGVVKYLAVIAWPLVKLGKLEKEAAPAFLMAFQSGAVANSMLVSSRSDGSIDGRQLYTSVLVVSCLSLFAHLPTYVVPIGSVLGVQATVALFAVRFVAIFLEILVVLAVSRFVILPSLRHRAASASDASLAVTAEQLAAAQASRIKAEARLERAGGFWPTVWKRSRRTLLRLVICLIPTYAILATLEYNGFFRWLTGAAPGLFKLSFLPAESAAIIPAQAMSLYNGAIVAASFLDSGEITVQQAVLTILVGSMVTAPVRTLKHALPTYLAVLGPRAGLIMAIGAQVLRMAFLAGCTVVMLMIWNG